MSKRPSIFVSYSTVDESIARIVRNLFEERGHDTQLLKLQQTMTDDFIMDLLRKEVAANDWMVVIDSQHAKQSNWVMFERAVAGIYHKRIYHIDADQANTSGDNQSLGAYLSTEVASISRRLRVFISYAARDSASAARIRETLEQEGYETLDGRGISDVKGGPEWEGQVRQAIQLTMQKGVLIFLVSKASGQSVYARSELMLAMHFAHIGQGRVLPCLLSDNMIDGPFELVLSQYIDFRSDFDRGLGVLTSSLASL